MHLKLRGFHFWMRNFKSLLVFIYFYSLIKSYSTCWLLFKFKFTIMNISFVTTSLFRNLVFNILRNYFNHYDLSYYPKRSKYIVQWFTSFDQIIMYPSKGDGFTLYIIFMYEYCGIIMVGFNDTMSFIALRLCIFKSRS